MIIDAGKFKDKFKANLKTFFFDRTILMAILQRPGLRIRRFGCSVDRKAEPVLSEN